MNTQYRKNLKAVAQACKDYTDEKIKKVYYDIGHNDITTDDHTDEATYQITAPANAKLLMLQAIGGNAVKYSPSVASDDTLAFEKTLPDNAYEVQCNYIGGYTEKSENILVLSDVAETTDSGITYKVQNGIITLGGTATSNLRIYIPIQPITSGTYSYNQFSKNAGHNVYLSDDTSATNTQLILTNSTTTSATSITITTTMNYLYFYIGNGNVITNYTFTPMLVSGTTAPTTFKQGFTGLRSAKTSEIDVSGANIYNQEWELGAINYNNGEEVDSTTSIRSKWVAVKPNTTYYFYCSDYNGGSYWIVGYDNSQNYVSGIKSTASSNGTFTTPNNCYYIRFRFNNAYGDTYRNNVCIVKGSTAPTSFIPYVAPITKQIPSAILNNQYYGLGYDNTHYNKLDLITKNIYADWKLITINGSENWYKNEPWSSENNVSMYVGYDNQAVTNSSALMNYSFSNAGDSAVNSTTTDQYRLTNVIYLNFTAGGGKISEFTVAKAKEWLSNNPLTILYNMATQVVVDVSQYIDDEFKKFALDNNYTNVELINEYNYDIPNKLEYYGTIKETLCPSITITRNGVDILTRNLPTQASDGWSAGTQRNYRVFCDDEGNEVLKRETNVNKGDMGDYTYSYNATKQYFTANVSDVKVETYNVIGNSLSKIYTNVAYTTIRDTLTDKILSLTNGSDSNIYVRNLDYDNATIFKTAMANEPLYYELADASKTETDMDDFDYFFDVEEGDVITFNNPYAQQVYATYSFLIKEAKSNE